MSSPLSRSARGDINQLPCVFAAALSQRCVVCSLSRHDDTQLLCTQPLARATCATLHGQLRDKARFALGLRQARPSRTAELRLQCSGLAALRSVLDAEALATDVQRLLERLPERQLETLPWDAILRALAAMTAQQNK